MLHFTYNRFLSSALHYGCFSLALLFFSACTQEKNGKPINLQEAVQTSENLYSPVEKAENTEVDNFKEYFAWVRKEKNGLYAHKQLGVFDYTLFYKPALYECLRQTDEALWEENKISAPYKDLSSYQYVLFTIKASTKEAQDLLKINLNSQDEYKARVQYCSFGIQQDVLLIDGSDTLRCAFAHFERTFDHLSRLQFSLAFPVTKGTGYSAKTLVFHDHLFDMGQVNIAISAQAIKNIPRIKNTRL